MSYFTGTTRYKTTCSKIPGVMRVSQVKPKDVCPICLKPLHVKNSCAVIVEMSAEEPIKTHKKVGPNRDGPPAPRAKSLANARMDLQARARRPNLRIN